MKKPVLATRTLSQIADILDKLASSSLNEDDVIGKQIIEKSHELKELTRYITDETLIEHVSEDGSNDLARASNSLGALVNLFENAFEEDINVDFFTK